MSDNDLTPLTVHGHVFVLGWSIERIVVYVCATAIIVVYLLKG